MPYTGLKGVSTNDHPTYVFPSCQTSAEIIGLMYPGIENSRFCYPDLPIPSAWECAYCENLNSKDELRCDGCGAGRPKEKDNG